MVQYFIEHTFPPIKKIYVGDQDRNNIGTERFTCNSNTSIAIEEY